MDANGEELTSRFVGATSGQCATWVDDNEFAAVLAANAGLSVL